MNGIVRGKPFFIKESKGDKSFWARIKDCALRSPDAFC